MAGHFCGGAAGHQPGAVLAAVLAIGQHAVALPRRDHRPELGLRIEGIADANSLRLRLQLLDELVIDRGLNDVARCADASLPRADKGTERGIIDRAIDVEVVKHHHRSLAAEFQGLVREHFGRRAASNPAGFGAAGQHQLVDVTMFGKHPAGCLAKAEHDIEHAGRQPRLSENLRQLQRRQRRIFRRLDDSNASAGQHRSQRFAHDHQRVIERRAVGDDADRRAHGIIQVRTLDRYHRIAA